MHFSCNEDQTLQESLIVIQLLCYACRAVNPPHLQIFRIDREGVMIHDVIMHSTYDVICAKNTRRLLTQNARKRMLLAF